MDKNEATDLWKYYQSFPSKGFDGDMQTSDPGKSLAKTYLNSAFSAQTDFSQTPIKTLTKQIEQCNDTIELYCLAERELKNRGISSFLLLPYNEVSSGCIDTNACLSNWPVSMLNMFCEQNLFDRIVADGLHQSHQETDLFHCSLAQTVEPFWESRSDQFSQFAKIDETIGCIRSARFPKNSRMLCLFSWEADSSLAFTVIAQELGQLLVDKFSALKAVGGEARPSLSKREQECIQWTSEGKTSYEIAIILCLSEHTINNYIATVSRKLGATNRAHLMSIAHRMKLVS